VQRGTQIQDEYDVIVIGGGGAGLSAAASAARCGRSVLLIEKTDALGGSTAWSVGSVTACNTPHQRRAGIKDTPDEHFEDLGKFAGSRVNRDNLELRRLLVDNVSETFDWLLSTGLRFSGPSPEPPHRHARMHNVLPNSRAFPHHLARHCRSLGVDIRLSTLPTRLIRIDGRIAGVAVRTADREEREVRARNGVVLASGDISASKNMKAQLATEVSSRTPPVNVANTGDGLRLGVEAGGEIVNGDIMLGPRLRFAPPKAPSLLGKLPQSRLLSGAADVVSRYLPGVLARPVLMSFVQTALGVERSLFNNGAIMVNAQGDRFVDELTTPAEALVEQNPQIGYVILDARIARLYSRWPNFISTAPGVAYAYIQDYRRNRLDITREEKELDLLARGIGMSAGRLTTTLAESNKEAAATGRPQLLEPPYIALGPVKPYVVLADASLRVTLKLEVLGSDGAPIPGLYAAGSTGQGGLLLDGHGHHLAWAFVSGRIAGRSAALCRPESALEPTHSL
jgi:succinate dehydrogenase/fumarate reductase flavoprotein subunit